jgi:prepilin peptidase CpaA
VNVLVDWGPDVVLVVSAVLALWGDLRERRIYDWITLPTLGLALVLAFAAGGAGEGVLEPGLQSALVGLLAVGGFFLVAWFFGWLGLGDVKLMAGYGALFGFPAALGMLVFVSLVGGVQGVLTAIVRTAPGKRLLVRMGVVSARDEEFGLFVPYGVAIAVGAVLFRIWQRWPQAPEMVAP